MTDQQSSGRIFDISRGAVDDGPGLRTVVFFKGCHLGCPWCHNPEGRSFEPEIAFDAQRCIGCRRCEQACPRSWGPEGWRRGCTGCGRCAEACPSGARRLAGEEISARALVDELLADLDFFAGTGGGVTFSGGEPTAQPGFLLACARLLGAEGVHLTLETSGHFPAGLVEDIAALFDLVLFDLKHADLSRCEQALGTASPRALENLAALLEAGVALELRITLVPGFNDADGDLESIARRLSDMPRRPPVRLQAFHRLASAKQALFDRPYPYANAAPITDRQLERAGRILAGHGIALVEPVADSVSSTRA
ncbi:MAG: glycyl-radical enzyme activating protein [Deltaproteobacteria bacterium]|nr:glycyl-radical enzyme activating protein [Deltaproteobacteria bacterium]